MTTALAYVDWGRWIADCPAAGCLDAVAAYPAGPGTPAVLSQTCFEHRHPIDISLPANQADIDTELGGRVDVGDRYWFPAGHPRAVAQNLPHGLTMVELAAETAALNARRSA